MSMLNRVSVRDRLKDWLRILSRMCVLSIRLRRLRRLLMVTLILIRRRMRKFMSRRLLRCRIVVRVVFCVSRLWCLLRMVQESVVFRISLVLIMNT